MDNFFMTWGRRTWRRAAGREAVAGGVPGVPRSTADDSGGRSADYGAHVVTPVGRRSLLVPAWYRGVTLIMQTMGQMQVQYQRLNRPGGNFAEDRRGEARRLNYLFQVRPNPLMTASQMMEQIEYRKIYDGNAYVFVDRGFTGDVEALWLCSSGSYDSQADAYTLTYRRRGGLVTTVADSGDVLHFKNVIQWGDTFQGIPTMAFALKSLSIAATANEQTLKDMAKGGRYKLVLQEERPQGAVGITAYGRAAKQELQQAADRFGENLLSKDVVALNNIQTVTPVSQTAAELKLLENRGFEVADLSRILGIPTIMMMLDTGNNYKTPEAATQEFLLRTIQPRIREMEDELNSKLLGATDFGQRRIHVCEQALRRLDPKQQADLDKLHLETGAMNVNEIRAQYDLPAVDGGDAHYVSTNLAEVGSEKLRSPNAFPDPSKGRGDGTPDATKDRGEGGAQ